jgi:hypothetical protein
MAKKGKSKASLANIQLRTELARAKVRITSLEEEVSLKRRDIQRLLFNDRSAHKLLGDTEWLKEQLGILIENAMHIRDRLPADHPDTGLSSKAARRARGGR